MNAPVRRWILAAVLLAAACHEITDVTPDPAAPGDDITITGRGFDGPTLFRGVYHDGEELEVLSRTDREIVATLPAVKSDGSYTLVVDMDTHEVAAEHSIENPPPEIFDIHPDPAYPGEPITIEGRYFQEERGEVRHDGVPMVISIWDEAIIANLPSGLADGSYPIEVRVGDEVVTAQHTVENVRTRRFQRYYGGQVAADAVQTADGGYLVAGWRLVRADALGASLWTLDVGGDAVIEAADGRVVMVGYVGDDPDMYLLATNADGAPLWVRTFDSDSGHEDYAKDVIETSDGGFLLAGFTQHLSASNADVFLVKTDDLGNEQWARTLGGSGGDRAWSVASTTDGGYVVAGDTSSSGAGGLDAYLLKIDAAGNELWSRSFGGAGDDRAYSVAQSGDGGYVLAGDTRGESSSSSDMLLIKTDGAGNELWSRGFGWVYDDAARDVVPTADGGYLLAGWRTRGSSSTITDAALVKTDALGDELWTRRHGYGTHARGYAVAPTADGGYVLAGEDSLATFGDMYLVKTDAEGYSAYPTF